MQATSWADPSGHPSQPPLVAQVYFSTDRKDLDGSDRAALNRLVQLYRSFLADHRIELAFVGHADYRGAAAYNQQLGLARARAVERFMHQQLRHFTNFSSWPCLSRGEQEAAQRRPDALVMAGDRRVDVYSNFVLNRSVEMPPLRITSAPRRQRIAERHFSRFSANNLGRPPSPQDQAWQDAKNSFFDLITGGREKLVYGDEEVKQRKTIVVPATHQVNEVVVEHRHTYETKGFAEIERSHTMVRYTWGEPTAHIIVKRRTVVKLHGHVTSDVWHHESIPRQEGSGSPLVFPPDP